MKRDKDKTFWSQLRDTVLILGKSFDQGVICRNGDFSILSATSSVPTHNLHPLLLKLWSVVSNGHHVLSDLLLNKECLPSSSGNQVSLLPRVYSACGRSLKNLDVAMPVSFNLPLLSVHLAVTPEVLV